jgi:hypothetical protein
VIQADPCLQAAQLVLSQDVDSRTSLCFCAVLAEDGETLECELRRMADDPRLCHWKRSSVPSVRGPIFAHARARRGCKDILLLTKRRGEMQVSNPARISRAIPVATDGR